MAKVKENEIEGKTVAETNADDTSNGKSEDELIAETQEKLSAVFGEDAGEEAEEVDDPTEVNKDDSKSADDKSKSEDSTLEEKPADEIDDDDDPTPTESKDDKGEEQIKTPSSDLYGSMAQADSELGTGAGERFKRRFYEEAKQSSLSAGKTGEIKPTLDYYTTVAENILSAAASGERTPEEASNDLDQLSRVVFGNMGEGIASEYLLGEDGKIDDARKAIEDLVGIGFGGAFKPEQKDKWVNRHKDDLNKQMLQALFDSYVASVSIGGI